MAEFQQDFLEDLTATSNGNANKIKEKDQAFHDWYRFVLSYPPHLVRKYLAQLGLSSGETILDPFSGTGTTLVESKLRGFSSIGVEANPFAHFSGQVKTSWDHDTDQMETICQEIVSVVAGRLNNQGVDKVFLSGPDEVENLELLKLEPKKQKLLIRNSISSLPLHKTLVLKSEIDQYKDQSFYPHMLLALAKSTVFSVSNLRFGPEVGVGKLKTDAPVVDSWVAEFTAIIDDLKDIDPAELPNSTNILGDSRRIADFVPPNSIDAVITSPPYPNEKDYSRTTRLESVLLGLIDNPKQLQSHKKTFVRSNTRGVYKDDDDYEWVKDIDEITNLASRIEERRIELGKTSGFEKRYAKVTLEYFGGMARHLSQLRQSLRPGARLAYVVGDQASYLRIMIRTGKLLAQIAESLGYSLEGIDLFRTRFATATREELREEVLILKWDGKV